MKKLWLGLLLLVVTAHGQHIPTDYFENPLEIPLILSGSFGELRSNHFHSGLDIKTQQREGIPIYAPADGYVSRIKVAHYGYGKALYIKHPNGYSTVYAHLQQYAGDIQAYIKEQQYKKESFEIELYPSADRLPVKKGDIIGYTGNSGSSGGPHLHYEIRDAASRPMNPMLFGIEVPDHKKPLVNAVMAYPIGENAHINQQQDPIKLRLILQQDGSYKAEKITALGKIGFGVSTNDQLDGASNKNGVYTISSTYNGANVFNVRFEKFSFDETRYLNRYIDYGYYQNNRTRVQKLFRETNNPLSIIKEETDNGYVTVKDGFTSNYNISITDYKGNEVQIVIPIEGADLPDVKPKTVNRTDDYIYANQATSITKGKFSLYIPANSLYEDTYLDIEVRGDTLHFHDDVVPLHRNVTISVDASNYSASDMSKLYIGRLNYRGDPYYNTTYKKGNKLSARTRTMGSYVLVSDTTGPTISPVNFDDGKWISSNKTLKIKIEDDLSGVSTYRATINGKFILTEYNYKTDVLTYDFDDNVVTETENNLKVIVVDNVGNSTTFEATFFRK
ncbi:MAG: M23 family metallopeptidase [Flavobacteriales bacterium]|uniref:M23 family metallopeptidase n=1 Tax=Candidatus Ulvibacter alkanivorans TaxID=2267620 RepID=UPI000DF389E1|nr:M23 family metallopeptidase [Candidatus Ulvibacter alkanivorans]MCH2489168.1 M23 family metallopeptidase [Flavobacteriales bacterium]